MRGDYVEDANAYTAPVESYSPNDYGLYNMSGNVAEWTNTAFDETVYDFSWDLSPDYVYHAKVDDPLPSNARSFAADLGKTSATTAKPARVRSNTATPPRRPLDSAPSCLTSAEASQDCLKSGTDVLRV